METGEGEVRRRRIAKKEGSEGEGLLGRGE